jgi:flavin reductase (DIM6/NTAB) family NADH-FMN oxidoreductase RutF
VFRYQHKQSLLPQSRLERLDRFDRNDFLEANHEREVWRIGLYGLPYLETAATSYFCRVIGAHDYGDQTIFVGRIEGVRLNQDIDPAHADPLIWMNGGPVRLAGREML